MTIEKWEEIKIMLNGGFTILENYTVEDPENKTSVESVEFLHPTLGKMKAEFTRRPRGLEKRDTYSQEMESAKEVARNYDKSPEVCEFKLFTWQEGREDWQQSRSDDFGF